MNQRASKRPSQFEVALEKGDYLPPGERPRPYTFYDQLEAFITFYERLGTPGSGLLYRLGKWKALQRDIRRTASDLGMDASALYKQLARLEAHYHKASQPPPPKRKEKRPGMKQD